MRDVMRASRLEDNYSAQSDRDLVVVNALVRIADRTSDASDTLDKGNEIVRFTASEVVQAIKDQASDEHDIKWATSTAIGKRLAGFRFKSERSSGRDRTRYQFAQRMDILALAQSYGVLTEIANPEAPDMEADIAN